MHLAQFGQDYSEITVGPSAHFKHNSDQQKLDHFILIKYRLIVATTCKYSTEKVITEDNQMKIKTFNLPIKKKLKQVVGKQQKGCDEENI